MTIEQARSELILFHDVSNPTEQDIAVYALYGASKVPFIQAKGRTQVANSTISGGNRMKDLHTILLNLRGTKQLLSLFCTSTKEIKADIAGNAQEALFQIEEMLENSIKDLEDIVYNK